MKNYMREDLVDEYCLLSLQNKILEIAIYIDEICRQNNIDYYVCGGCALGAIRHGGFIPWDDDLDIFMTNENYYKFIDVCKVQLDTTRFYLQIENTKEMPSSFSKLRLNGTTYIEAYNENINMHKGIYVDIFRLDNISDKLIPRYCQYIYARLFLSRALTKSNYKTNNIYKKLIMRLMSLLPDTVDVFLLKQIKKYNSTKTKDVANLFHRGSFKSNIIPKEWLGKAKYVRFERIMLPVPSQVEKYLSRRFDDYKVIPPSHLRKVKSHVMYYDTNE